ncbi:MAG: ATP-binding protein [Solirubrobacteraceae bacterium]
MSLVFAVVLAAVLFGTGLFLDLRFAAEMDHGIDQNLRSRAGDVIALVRQADSGLRQAGPTGLNNRTQGFAQVLDPRGRIFDASPLAGTTAALKPADLPRIRPTGRFLERTSVAGLPGDVRLFAIPVRAQGQNLIVVVGRSLDERDAALRDLEALLLIGGAGALVLSALAGYLAIAGALRPIELMRRRAEQITAAEPGPRLPLPPTGDEVARLGGTLNLMLERLEGALRHERTFVMDASHELRTPLAILKMEFDLALRGPRTQETLESTIRSAAEETERLTRLADGLLVIARGEQGELQLAKSRQSSSELLKRVRDRFAKRAHESSQTILVSGANDVSFDADGPRIEQALGNLIENALTYSSGDITLWVAGGSGSFELHVSDQGPGFAPGFLPEAFRRFAREDNSRSSNGTGLGLSIVAAIAAAHSGTAQAANRPGGADVWLTLPVRTERSSGSQPSS